MRIDPPTNEMAKADCSLVCSATKSLCRVLALVMLVNWQSLGQEKQQLVADESVSRTDQLARQSLAQAPGIAVVVRKNGRSLLAKGYGIKSLSTGDPVTSTTDFRLASCTKQFTAMAIMLLVHDGKLKYETRLTDVFPDFPVYTRSITVRHLLNHTSGLPDYEDLMEHPPAGMGPWTEEHQISDAEVLTLLKATKAGKFPPGSKWSYSNSGYVTLGLIVAKVSGSSFPDFLRTRIFTPLKMSHTLAYVKGSDPVPERAFGNTRSDAAAGPVFKQTDQSSTSGTLGDGGIYSNLEDLAKWDFALENHTLLSASEMKPALTPVRLPDGSLPRWAGDPGDSDPLSGNHVEYGFGWFLTPYHGHQRSWHYGDTRGFRSAIMRFPAERLTVIVLANSSELDAAALAEKIADSFLTPSTSEATPHQGRS